MEGTSQVKRNKRVGRVKVSADGVGVVSHAGVGLLREMAEYTGLVQGVTEALIDTYAGPPVQAPGRVFTDLAVAIADGADAVSGIAVLGDRPDLFCLVPGLMEAIKPGGSSNGCTTEVPRRAA